MSAGESARLEAEASARQAQELREAAAEADRRSRNFAKGGAAEEEVGRRLGELGAYDIQTLHDRRWPGTRNANIDHLVVGTCGVLVIDTKHWADDLKISEDGLYRGQLSCEEDLDKVRRMADAVSEQLVEEGLPPTQVLAVLAFFGRSIRAVNVHGVWVMGADELPNFILLRGKLLTQLQVEQLLARLMIACPPAASRAISRPRAVQASAGATLTDPEDGVLVSRRELEDAALEAAMRAPLADWMVFLHPDQAKLVRRSLNGPSRISGPAGTGKSVVALHRLAYLAERRRHRLLYVTYVKVVPRVLGAAYRRLSPHTAERVDFANLHSWAFRFVRERGLVRTVDRSGIEEAFAEAWRSVGRGSLLEKSAAEPYWRDEVDSVVRGRSLTRLDDYLDLDRLGRGSRLGSQQRRVVWALKEAYEAELHRRRLHDWNDLLRIARDEVRRRPPDPSYDVVILDEAQDMPLVAAELLHALAGHKPDGLMLVGDDQQRIFPGGFRLSEAGIDVTGRSTRLTRNYRNTEQILRSARSLVAGEDDDLLEGVTRTAGVETSRSGEEPVFVRAMSRADHGVALSAQLQRLLSSGAAAGDIALLVETHAQARQCEDLLAAHGIPSVRLAQWDGLAADAVVIGTIKSAKGLEFKHVLVSAVDPILMQADQPTDEFMAELWRLRRRELYVAMTRARDSLWVGCVDDRRQTAVPVPPQQGCPGPGQALLSRVRDR